MHARTKVMNQDKPFRTVNETIAATGLSEFYLRQGIKNGTVPHIRSGNAIFINYPMLMERLNRESCKQAEGEG